MRIQSIAFLCIFSVICNSLHLRWHQYHTLMSPTDLRSKVQKVLTRLKNLNNTINNNVSSINPYSILDRIDSLENIIKQSRLQMIEIYGQSQDLSSNSQYYCQSLSANDSNSLMQSMNSISVTANQLSQQKAINVDNSSLKGLPTQIVETSQNITQLTNSQTLQSSSPPKIIYQPNLLAQNWALGSLSMKDLDAQSQRLPGQNNAYCPPERPYPDSSNNCIQCLSTYNIQTKSCFTCSNYDAQLHKCNDSVAPTNNLNNQSTSPTTNSSTINQNGSNPINSSTSNQGNTTNSTTNNQTAANNTNTSTNQSGTTNNSAITNPTVTNATNSSNTNGSGSTPVGGNTTVTNSTNDTGSNPINNTNNTGSNPTSNTTGTNSNPINNITGTPTNISNSSNQSPSGGNTSTTNISNNTVPATNQSSGGTGTNLNGTNQTNPNSTGQINPNGTSSTNTNGTTTPTPIQRVSSPKAINGILLPPNQTIQDYKNSVKSASNQPNTIPCPDSTPFFDGTSCIQCLNGQFFSSIAKNCQTCPSNQNYNSLTFHCQSVLYYSNPNNKFWTSIGRSPSDIIKDINATSQQPNSRSCPPEKPYFTGKQCIQCASPKPIYSYDGAQCTSCIAPAVFDPNIYSCATPQKMQTNPSTSPSLILDGRSLNQWRVYYYNNQTADPQISDCPTSKPYFDGVVCLNCPAQQPYFNLQYRICQSCPLNTEYDASVRDCLSNSGNIVTQSPNVLKMAAGIFA